MANPTSNFGWQMPTNTDLVKDLPADFEVFGQAVDTSLMDLKGGTTGQVLSKASNTDMDFTWVTSDDANAIQNTIVDAKGDLISATGNDVPARLAVGNNGETLVADSSASTGLRWQGNFAAGKNKIINGDFSIWQRGTSLTANDSYLADRFKHFWNGNGTFTVTRESFTAGTAPVAGYEGTYFHRTTCNTVGTTTLHQVSQLIEDVRTFAGQTITISFWAKASTASSGVITGFQVFGTGGSGAVTILDTSISVTTSWARYSATVAVPSISGKTIGTNNAVSIIIRNTTIGAGNTFDVWGVQVEAGNTATAFQTATGTLQGELAACQRYYFRTQPAASTRYVAGMAKTTTTTDLVYPFPVTMRTSPTALEQSGTAGDYGVLYQATGAVCSAVPTIVAASNAAVTITFTVASGLTAGNATIPYAVNATGYLGWSAEL